MPLDARSLNRFMQKVKVNEITGCWEWVGGKFPSGYGSVTIDSKVRLAHRVSYEHYVDSIRYGSEVDHICMVRSCVNPAHLQQVTRSENQFLASKRKENFNSAKTHCKNGHEFNEDNTYYYTIYSGTIGRFCRACRRSSNRKYTAKRNIS